ncbi:PAS domain S-box protein [Maridesulfovibrio hydrothermalis]|uniref:histidine kinase n=1 Tax=Maridesulfovibrio hydrothermalis AM13 = DSM 14728 TaxID=1121451 RepID=L0RFE4_9BACT|nr:PAS domain S-box protein [Maridesulfovibrio hydrothermalis]CCO25508.1 exported protein of unknown function [Maridesulfovibrio hydrothermalis AM13 = DSM 14728]
MDNIKYWRRWLWTTFLPIALILGMILLWAASRESAKSLELLRVTEKSQINSGAMGVTIYLVLLAVLTLISVVLQRSKIKRLKAVDEMLQSEFRLREAEKLAHLGSWETDLESGEHIWSDEVFRILGYDPGEVTPALDVVVSHVLPEDRDTFLKGISVKKGTTDMEIGIIKKGGDRRHLRIKRKVVEVEGRLSKVYGTVLDLTEQKERMDELRRLWSTIEQCPASIVITDQDANIQYVNSFFTKITGYTFDDVVGRNPRILKSGRNSKEFYKNMWAVLNSGLTWRGEFSNKRKNGEIFWEGATISPIKDYRGVITHFIAVKEDVTERKNKDLELKKVLSEFEVLFENSAVGIAYMKGGRTFHRVNHRFCEITGYTPAELIGNNSRLLYLSEEKYLSFWPEVKEKLLAGEVVQKEVQLVRKDGSIVWGLLAGRTISPGNLAEGLIWTLDDISPRKDLERMREDVERIMRHDLKSPLNGIINLPRVIAFGDNLTDDQLENLELIEDAGKRMLAQINASLDLYKIEIGTYEFIPQKVDLVKIVRKLAKESEPFALVKGVGIDVLLRGEPLNENASFMVLGKDDFCFTMLSNVLKNAIEASPSDSRVTLLLLEEEGLPAVKIHNDGAVPHEIRDVFFEKYSTSGKAGGMGLGSYSARMLAEVQGCAVNLDTSEKNGTTISFVFCNG